MSKLAPTWRANPEQATRQFNMLQAQLNQRVNRLLTPQQQASHKGTPYQFKPGVCFNPGGSVQGNPSPK